MAVEKKKEAAKVEHSGTPSSIAVAEVGPVADDASDEQKRAKAEAYAAAKKKARWG